MEPGVRIRHRTDGLLVFTRVLGSQLLPGVGRMRDVLHSSLASCRIFSLEVERAEVDCVISRFIHSMKSYAHEALLLNVLPSDIELDRAVAELDSWQVRYAFARAFAQPKTRSRPVTETARGAVEDLETLAAGQRGQFGLEGSLLTGNAGSGEETACSKQSRDKRGPVHRFP